MKLHSKSAIAAIALLFGVMGLSGCGGGATFSPGPDQDTAAEAEDSEAPQEEPVGGDQPDGSDAGKPSKSAVIDGYTLFIEQTVGSELPPETDVQAIVECIVDEIYDTVAVETLWAFADKQPWRVEEGDLLTITAANAKCGDFHHP